MLATWPASPTSGTNTEPEKGHKLVDFAGRCVSLPGDEAEIRQDHAWESTSTCLTEVGRVAAPAFTVSKTATTATDSWEEGSHLKEYKYKFTGGTGKYVGATGGGTDLIRKHNRHHRGRNIQRRIGAALSSGEGGRVRAKLGEFKPPAGPAE